MRPCARRNAALGDANCARVYDALVARIKQHGYPPTVRDLAADTGLGIGIVSKHVHALARDGRIVRGPARSALQIALPRDDA